MKLNALTLAAAALATVLVQLMPGLPVARAERPIPIAASALRVDDDRLVLRQGQAIELRVWVQRPISLGGRLSVQLTGLPVGVQATAATLPAQQDIRAAESSQVVTLQVRAAITAPHSLPTPMSVQLVAVDEPSAPAHSLPLTLTVRGAPGSVDTSFGEAGSAWGRASRGEDYAHAVAVQADGKVLVAGHAAGPQGPCMAVMRYQRDGTPDTGFGTEGVARLDLAALGTRDHRAMAIAVQPDGRIVLAGSTLQDGGHDFALVRLLADGQPDPAFGQHGVVVTDFGGDFDRAHAVLLLPDGSIVTAGRTNRSRQTGQDFALARHSADGRLDQGFGEGGRVVTSTLPGSQGEVVRGLALQTVDGQPRLLAVGGEGDFIAARYKLDGAPDASFGRAGIVRGVFGSNIGSAAAVVTLPDGRAVIAGHVGHDFAAVRLLADGRLDAAFGPARDGRFRLSLAEGGNWDEATALANQADGALLLGGWAYAGTGTSGDFAALRLLPNGTLDAAFGHAGVLRAPVAAAGKADLGRAMALQFDSRIPAVRAVMAGEAQDRTRDFVLLRLWL